VWEERWRAVSAELKRFARFLAVGGLAAGVNVMARIGLSEWMGFRWAVVWAYLAGMLAAFVLSKQWVFDPSGRGTAREIAGFALVNLLAVAQVWLVSVGLAEWLFPALEMTWHAELVAHCVGLAVPAVTSYFGHKHLSFRPHTARKT
jgi:putative flippase GtrA